MKHGKRYVWIALLGGCLAALSLSAPAQVEPSDLDRQQAREQARAIEESTEPNPPSNTNPIRQNFTHRLQMGWVQEPLTEGQFSTERVTLESGTTGAAPATTVPDRFSTQPSSDYSGEWRTERITTEPGQFSTQPSTSVPVQPGTERIRVQPRRITEQESMERGRYSTEPSTDNPTDYISEPTMEGETRFSPDVETPQRNPVPDLGRVPVR